MHKFAVVTRVPVWPDRGNAATAMNLAVDTGGGWDEPLEVVPISQSLHIRYPVFSVGELLVLDDRSGREVGYPGRKPSKWNVTVEMFTDIEEAVQRARDVMYGNDDEEE